MKNKRLFWKIFLIVVGVVVIMGIGGAAIDNTKDLFSKDKDKEVIESVEDTTTQACIYDYEVA